MVPKNEDVKRTAFTVTVDANVGTTTGISAGDRARTLRVLADSKVPQDGCSTRLNKYSVDHRAKAV